MVCEFLIVNIIQRRETRSLEGASNVLRSTYSNKYDTKQNIWVPQNIRNKGLWGIKEGGITSGGAGNEEYRLSKNGNKYGHIGLK